MKQGVRLSQVLGFVENVISTAFKSPFWLCCELSDVKVNGQGHCFVQLLEKDLESDKIIAKSNGIIWSRSYISIKEKFEQTTGMSIASGVQVLLKVHVVFNEVYGLTFQIRDIDPSYTLGEIERKRRENLLRLEKEGLLDLNKHVPKPLCYQNVAVISSEYAAGYQDFVDQVVHNRLKFYCKMTLFSAILQGDGAERSILDAIQRVKSDPGTFDAVIVIRGGGSQSDLAVFDSYHVAKNLALLPVPVFTGIGHTKDQSVVDQVVAFPLKTPTAVADFIIEKMSLVYEKLNLLAYHFASKVNKLFEKEHELHSRMKNDLLHVVMKNRLKSRESQEVLFRNFQAKTKQVIYKKEQNLDKIKMYVQRVVLNRFERSNQQLLSFYHQMFMVSKIVLSRKNNSIMPLISTLCVQIDNRKRSKNVELDHFSRVVSSYDPNNILKRGYSIVKKNGKLVRSIEDVQVGDEIETSLSNFSIFSNVIKCEE
ncbi:exodeoxyribonuclease VII large subunit [Halosquirtibacter laminarini]|uniref:Exodeoxyribonuclease VII large subunit n=1 Tax=Halosquirtibacter laminarini TaxID=3374600 RepID=A0AC61NG54_9BACT|nr:exodeoxyribonuclease VII large subunit [Prolixibacteraceae bacterium]